MINRETLYAAVFAYFSALTAANVPLFKLATRKSTTWESVSPEDQPALLMRQKKENANYRKGLPTVWTLGFELLLYVHTGAQNDPAIVPAQLLNPLLDAIEDAITPNDLSTLSCTLGGLVSHCAIKGDIEVFEGVLGDEAVCIVPLEILVNG